MYDSSKPPFPETSKLMLVAEEGNGTSHAAGVEEAESLHMHGLCATPVHPIRLGRVAITLDDGTLQQAPISSAWHHGICITGKKRPGR